MLDLYFRYVIRLNQLLVNGIKWLINNENAYYIFMCSVPFIGTVISMSKSMKGMIFDGREEHC